MMTVQERARFALAVYAHLGPRRSLDKLQQALAEHEIDVGIATLKRWSARYRWQEQLADIDEGAELQTHADSVRQRVEMLERQGGLGRALQGLGGSALQALMNDQGRVRDLRARDITALIEVGTRLESGTSNEARSRKEIAAQLTNTLLVSVVQLFDDINPSADPEERRQRFAAGLDDIITHFVDDQEREN